MPFKNILAAVGHTPLIELNRMVEPGMARILVKFEALNVGGSIKTRTALRMIEAAEAAGILDEHSVVVEPTSGNQGVGLALVCAVKGYKARIIMPDSVSIERRALVEHYGAEVITVHDDGDIGACIEGCIELANSMAAKDSHVFVPQQFENPNNVAAHVDGTAAEIIADVDTHVHGFCSGIGTGGTITGVGRALKEQFDDVLIWAAEPEHAAILSGHTVGTHQQMGIGDGLIPAILDQGVIDQIEIVTDEEAFACARRLAREEGLMCGVSSGTNVTVALRMARKLGAGKTVVTILPDTAERYISTELFGA